VVELSDDRNHRWAAPKGHEEIDAVTEYARFTRSGPAIDKITSVTIMVTNLAGGGGRRGAAKMR